MSDPELEKFKRDINLVEYAEHCGYQQDRRESSRGSVVMRHPTTDDKIIVARAKDSHFMYFSVRDERDNGTIIDFVQRRTGKNLGAVRDELRRHMGLPRPERVGAEAPPDLKPVHHDRQEVARRFAAALEPENSRYLNERGLRPETLSDPKFAGTWKQDAKGNVLFAHRDEDGISGYELKSHGFTGFAPGGTKSLWQSAPAHRDSILVITESAIDALSYHQLRRQPPSETRYVSLGGAPSPGQLALLERLVSRMPQGSTIIAAVDADDAGNRVAKQIESIAQKHNHVLYQRDSPVPALGKDWNDVLKRMERDFIRSLPPLARGMQRSGPGLGR